MVPVVATSHFKKKHFTLKFGVPLFPYLSSLFRNSGFTVPLVFFLFHFVYLFLERGREGERKEEKHQCVVASHAPPTGDPAHSSGMYPDWESNQRPFGSQAGIQSTEPHQPGHAPHNILIIKIF